MYTILFQASQISLKSSRNTYVIPAGTEQFESAYRKAEKVLGCTPLPGFAHTIPQNAVNTALDAFRNLATLANTATAH
jgi:hypothetical protein